MSILHSTRKQLELHTKLKDKLLQKRGEAEITRSSEKWGINKSVLNEILSGERLTSKGDDIQPNEKMAALNYEYHSFIGKT